MIGGIKRMIAGCIERVSRNACGNCSRRDACSSLFGHLFRPAADRGQKAGPSRLMPRLLGRIVRYLGEQARMRDSVRGKVERLLEPRLAEGKLDADGIACALGCSRQTLYRRLKAEGTSFAAILDDLRRRRAGSMLRQGNSVKAVAYALGYSDPAAFSRAFKRWTGSSPSEARRRYAN